MIRTTIYLPEELHQKLKEKALKEKTSMAKIIINAFSDIEIIKRTPVAYDKPFVKERGEIRGEDYV